MQHTTDTRNGLFLAALSVFCVSGVHSQCAVQGGGAR